MAYTHFDLPPGCVQLAGSRRVMNVEQLEDHVALLVERAKDCTTTHEQRWWYAEALERFQGLLATARRTRAEAEALDFRRAA